MKLKDLSAWAKELRDKKNTELLGMNIKEEKIDKGRETLRMIYIRADDICKDIIKHDRFLNEIDSYLMQLAKWGFVLPADEKTRLEKLGKNEPKIK